MVVASPQGRSLGGGQSDSLMNVVSFWSLGSGLETGDGDDEIGSGEKGTQKAWKAVACK